MKKFCFNLLLILVLSSSIIAGLATTTAGLQIAVKVINLFSPANLQFTELQGNLLHGLTATNLSYQSKALTVKANHLELYWQWQDLLIKQLTITQLLVDGLSIHLSPQSSSHEVKQTHDLPVALKLQHAQITNLRVLNALDQQLGALQQLRLSATWHQDQACVMSQWQGAAFAASQQYTILIPAGQVNLSGTPQAYQLHSKFMFGFAGVNHWLTTKVDLTKTQTSLPSVSMQIKNDAVQGIFNFDATQKLGRWRLRILTLAKLMPQAMGALQSAGSIEIASKQSQLKLQLNTQNVSIADWFVGNLQLGLDIQGDPEKQRWQGRITRPLQLPGLGIRLHDSAVQLQLHHDKKVSFKGVFYSDVGRLNLLGEIDRKPPALLAKLTVTGNNFQIVNNAAYKIQASPRLQLAVSNQGVELKGSILIPKANIVLPQIKDTVEPSTDIVYLDQTRPQANKLPVFARVELKLGEAVNVNLLGLQAQLGGKLIIIEKPKQPTTANGELSITKGLYQAYGQNLTIQQGRIFFVGGPINNPGLDVTAARVLNVVLPSNTMVNNLPIQLSTQTTKLLVGIKVEGTAKQPQISLFANPAVLSDTDILSYLILGRSPTQATTADAQFLLHALDSLNPNGHQFTNIVNQLQTTFGLDELSINSKQAIDSKTNDTLETTSLILGKRLSPRLYLNYIVDLTDQNNILQFRYTLGKNWILQTQAGTVDSGIDLFYTIER